MAKDDTPTRNAGRPMRAADDLFRAFVDMIERGELAEGDTLPPEREIVETHGVSRTVAREAIQRLASRGLVEARPRFRPIVRRPSFETAIETMGAVVSRLMGDGRGVRDLYETRVLVETALVRAAARTATPADISRLARALQANLQAIDDSDRFFETDHQFHFVLYDLTANPVLTATHSAFVEWLSPYWRRMEHVKGRNAANYAAHVEIFDAIQKGDEDGAERAMRDHLADAWEQVRHTFE